MPELDIAHRLLALARDDAKALEVMLRSNEVPRRICGFHAQQAVEKALKAWLVLLDADFPLTHSLFALLTFLREAGAECSQYEALAELSPYAVELRYGESETEADMDPAGAVPGIADLLSYVGKLLEAAEAGQ